MMSASSTTTAPAAATAPATASDGAPVAVPKTAKGKGKSTIATAPDTQLLKEFPDGIPLKTWASSCGAVKCAARHGKVLMESAGEDKNAIGAEFEQEVFALLLELIPSGWVLHRRVRLLDERYRCVREIDILLVLPNGLYVDLELKVDSGDAAVVSRRQESFDSFHAMENRPSIRDEYGSCIDWPTRPIQCICLSQSADGTRFPSKGRILFKDAVQNIPTDVVRGIDNDGNVFFINSDGTPASIWVVIYSSITGTPLKHCFGKGITPQTLVPAPLPEHDSVSFDGWTLQASDFAKLFPKGTPKLYLPHSTPSTSPPTTSSD